MATKTELEARIAELEAAHVTADTLNQISRDVNAARDEDEVLHFFVELSIWNGLCIKCRQRTVGGSTACQKPCTNDQGKKETANILLHILLLF